MAEGRVVTFRVRMPGFRFDHLGDATESVFGHPAAQWGEPGFWQSLIHPEDREPVVRYCSECTEAGSDHVFDYRMVAADGRVLRVRDIVSVRKGPAGERLLRGAFVDITDLPASAPVGIAPAGGLASAGRAAASRGDLAAVSEVETRLARDPALARPPVSRATDLVSVATMARRTAARDAALPEDTVPLRIHPELGAAVHVDPDHLCRAIQLLIHTALSARGGLRAVELDPTETGLRVRLVRARSAIGVPPVSGSPVRVREQALAAGRIAWLVGRLGGSTELGASGAELWAEELHVPFSEPPESRGVGRRHGLLRVLYAEDNVTSAQVMSALLGLQGVHAEIAINGADAVTLWEEGAFDLVLMDLRMPVLDGIEATRRIRAREAATAAPRTPVIGISARVDETVRGRCREAGMDEVLAKPVRLEQLRALVERFGAGRWPHF